MKSIGAAGLALALLGIAPGAHADVAANVDGVVDRMRIDPHGRVSGVILQDGTEVVAPPGARAALVNTVRPGDRLRASAGVPSRVQIWDQRDGQYIDLGSADSVARGGGPVPQVAVPYARVDDATSLTEMGFEGTVAYLTHPPGGAPDGFVTTDGTQVYLVPGVASALKDVHSGDRLRVSGRGTTNDLGRSVWALTVGRPSGLVLLDMHRGVGAPELGLAAAPAR